jgi:hypothetical protein
VAGVGAPQLGQHGPGLGHALTAPVPGLVVQAPLLPVLQQLELMFHASEYEGGV